jgi:hypothetical protein
MHSQFALKLHRRAHARFGFLLRARRFLVLSIRRLRRSLFQSRSPLSELAAAHAFVGLVSARSPPPLSPIVMPDQFRFELIMHKPQLRW